MEICITASTRIIRNVMLNMFAKYVPKTVTVVYQTDLLSRTMWICLVGDSVIINNG